MRLASRYVVIFLNCVYKLPSFARVARESSGCGFLKLLAVLDLFCCFVFEVAGFLQHSALPME